MYPAFDWSLLCSGHHGYQRACDLVSGQASMGHSGHQGSHAPGRPILHLVSSSLAKDTGAAERARSKIQLLNGHSDVRESVEEVMQAIESDASIRMAREMSSASDVLLRCMRL
jgi:hypothetical protein